MRTVTFTRESDGETFTFDGDMPPYNLTNASVLPSMPALDVSGDEYSGVNGGYTLASRMQRRAVKIGFNVRECWNDSRSFLQLVAAGTRFFMPMDASLETVKFSMEVDLSDKDGSAFMMKHGSVTVPFNAPANGLGSLSLNNEMSFIFDDPNMYWVNGQGVVSGKILPAALPGTKLGEVWTPNGQQFTATGSQWMYPDDGGSGTPQTLDVDSSLPIGVDLKVFGQITNPKIVNSANGTSWEWDGTIPDGNLIHVDDEGQVTDWNGHRLYNAIGGLVAQPGLNTFELTGSNLVLPLKGKWLGSKNASTSQLLKNGSAVATNKTTNPKFLTGSGMERRWGASNSALPNNGGMRNTPDGKHSVSGIGFGGSPDFLPVSHKPAMATDITADDWISTFEARLNTKHVDHIAIKFTATDGTSGKWIVDSGWRDQPSPGNTDWHRYTRTFTSPSAGWLIFGVQPSSADSSNLTTADTVDFRHIFIGTQSDYQMVEDLGLDWFDGDTDETYANAYALVEIQGAI